MPLDAMSEQLRYWLQESEEARKAGNAPRIAQCEHLIRQCQKVIAALEEAATASGPAIGNIPRDDLFR
jgi:hypothetical protein